MVFYKNGPYDTWHYGGQIYMYRAGDYLYFCVYTRRDVFYWDQTPRDPRVIIVCPD